MTVRPMFATFFTSVMTMSAARESRPLVGSSRKNTGALETSSTATVSTLRWPGDKPLVLPLFPIIRPATGLSSRISNASSTKPRRWDADTSVPSLSLAENSSASSTVANSL